MSRDAWRTPGGEITRYGRFWAVYDGENALVCICVYRKGAEEVLRRLQSREDLEDRLVPLLIGNTLLPSERGAAVHDGVVCPTHRFLLRFVEEVSEG
jgi:hypothetical protein